MLEAQLSRLTASELVRQLADPERAYQFKNALVQDVTRASLLLGERKRLHRLVGEALEALYPERRTELAPLLAGHFEMAGIDDKSMTYAALAGDAAARINANAEALEHYTHALAVAEKLGASGGLVQELFLKRGRALEIQNQYSAALENYEAMTRLAEARDDRALALGAMMASATIYSIPSTAFDEPRAQALNDRALALARELDDKEAQAKILWNMMLMQTRAGKGFSYAAAYGEEALQIARENNLRERLAYLLNDLSTLHVFLGQPQVGEAYNLEARAMWLELGNMPMLGSNLGYAVMNHLFTGNLDQAIADSQEALRQSREINNSWNEAFAQTWIGEAYMERGEIETAERVMQAAIELGARVFPPTLVMTRADLARLYIDLGDPGRGIELASAALAVAEEKVPALRLWPLGVLAHGYIEAGMLDKAQAQLRGAPDIRNYDENLWYVISSSRAQIELALAEGDFLRAANLADDLVAELQRKKLRQFLPAALTVRGNALRGMGRLDEAEESLQEGQSLAEEMGAPWSLWKISALRARVLEQRGDKDGAGAYRERARALVDRIAARTPGNLRARFLQHAASEL